MSIQTNTITRNARTAQNQPSGVAPIAVDVQVVAAIRTTDFESTASANSAKGPVAEIIASYGGYGKSHPSGLTFQSVPKSTGHLPKRARLALCPAAPSSALASARLGVAK